MIAGKNGGATDLLACSRVSALNSASKEKGTPGARSEYVGSWDGPAQNCWTKATVMEWARYWSAMRPSGPLSLALACGRFGVNLLMM